MGIVFTKPHSLKDVSMHFCPGCGHGIAHRLIAEVVDELEMRERTVAVAPVGCAVLAYDYFNFDVSEAAHGRTPCVALGIKRMLPDRLVFSYQGDGDLAAIGCGEIIHTACRGELISVIFVNNGVYGMTGGQMAPTTLLEQRTTTTRSGRSPAGHGYPLPITELLSKLEGAVYVARGAVHRPKQVMQTRRFIKRAFEVQLAGQGFSMVEVLASCPVNWRLKPVDSIAYMEDVMIPQFPLGVLKDTASLSKELPP